MRGYVRYVDDFILVDPSVERLNACQRRIVAFLRERLKLEVRAKPILPVSRGVDFLGYVIRLRYRLPRRRVVDAFQRTWITTTPPSLPSRFRRGSGCVWDAWRRYRVPCG